jgi:uncharacterized protein involved in exopolysaccharide biosynthesis
MDRSTQTTLERPEDESLALASEAEEVADLGQEIQEPKLIGIARLLWARRTRLLRAALIITAGVLLIPRKYEATVQLMPPDSSALSGGSEVLGLMAGKGGLGSGGSSEGGASNIASTVGELLGNKRPGALFIGILESRTLQDNMIDRFDLRKGYWKKTYAAASDQLSSRPSITEEKKSGILKIEVEDPDRARATAMANAYVDELNKLLSKVNTTSAGKEREFLEQHLTVVHKELQYNSKLLSDYSSKNTTLDPGDQGKATMEATAALQGQLIAAQSELSGLEQIYTQDNVRVRSMKAHVEELEKQVNSLGGKGYNGATSLDPNSLYPSLRQLPVLGLQYAELYRNVKIGETIFELLTEAYEMARVEEAKETPSVKVLDAARVPEKLPWPSYPTAGVLGFLVGLVLGSCWLVAADSWSKVDPDQPYKAFVHREVLPALSRRTAAIRERWRRIKPPRSQESTGEDERM